MLTNIDDVIEKDKNGEGVVDESIQTDGCGLEIIEEEPQISMDEEIERQNRHYSRNYNMVMGDKPVSFFERMIELIFKHGIFRSIGAFLLIMACVMIWQFINALNYDKVAERIVTELVEKQTKDKLIAKDEHLAGSALRLRNNAKIQKVLTQLLYETGSDRVSVLEMHNGKENPSALPFVYCDMTYEETKGRVPFIADEYEQLNMGKYPFFTHLINERVIFYETDEVFEYDKKFYSKLAANDTKYIAMLVIKNELDVGFLVVSFMNKPEIERHKLLVKLNDCAQELGILLDLSLGDNIKDKNE